MFYVLRRCVFNFASRVLLWVRLPGESAKAFFEIWVAALVPKRVEFGKGHCRLLENSLVDFFPSVFCLFLIATTTALPPLREPKQPQQRNIKFSDAKSKAKFRKLICVPSLKCETEIFISNEKLWWVALLLSAGLTRWKFLLVMNLLFWWTLFVKGLFDAIELESGIKSFRIISLISSLVESFYN